MVRIGKRILSPTAINTYLSCPRKFFLRYVKRLKTRPSIHLIRGLIVHKTLHEFNKKYSKIASHMNLGKICKELIRDFNEKWSNARSSLDSLNIPEDQIQFFRHESELMLINFAKWLLRNGLSVADLCETKIWSDKLRVMGIIDAIHLTGEKIVLVDYKTSKYARITPDIERQAALYALMYDDKFGKTPDEVQIHFLKTQDDPLKIYVDENTLEYGKILIDSILEKTASNMEEDYPCTCGGYCTREFIGD